MKNLTLTVIESTEFLSCSTVDLVGVGNFLVPNKNLGNFVSLAVWIGRTQADISLAKVGEVLAEEADKLCAAAGITY